MDRSVTSRAKPQSKDYPKFTAARWLAWMLVAVCVANLPACRSAARPPTLANISPPALPSSNVAAKATSQSIASTTPQAAQQDSSIAKVSADPAAQVQQIQVEAESSLASASEALPVAAQVAFPEVQAASLPVADVAQTAGDAAKFVMASHAIGPHITEPQTTAVQTTTSQIAVSNEVPSATSSQPLAAMSKVQASIAGIRVGRGIVHVAYFNGSQGFPDAKYAVRTESLAPEQESVTTAIHETGKVAIAVYQDVNGDGTLNVNRFGIPVEPFAFSNNAMGKRGPPSFEEAAIDVGSPAVSAARAIRIQLP